MASKGVVVVGSANFDLFAYMPRFPKPGETLHGHRATACCGGKGSNQCVMSARMGAPTAIVARLGQDAFGATIRKAWEAEGIDIRCEKLGD
jgi:ribokinase